MSLKRGLDSPLPDNRTRKRLCSALHSVITASNISLNTPLTAYPPRPFDSPRNPFGRKWAKHTTRMLPAPIPWMRHIFLRFQFVRIGSAGALYRGVHRIVRVPLNYTFAHLRCLIAWLFCGQQRQSTTDEHLFEVKKNAKTYSFMYRPGQLKSGQTWAKISNTQDPYRRRRDSSSDDEEEDELCSDAGEDDQKGDVESEACGDEDEGGWDWKDEEDFTLAHVWPKGPDKECAVLYHHSPITQIHISVDHILDSRRRGASNTPHVFSAHGRVWLSPPSLPGPVFSVPAKKIKSPGHKHKPSSRHTVDEDTDEDYEQTTENRKTEEADVTGSETEDDDDDDNIENIDLELDINHWNGASNSFSKFLAWYMGSALPVSSPRDSSVFDREEKYLSERDMLFYPSTPDLTRSSSIFSSPGPTSSPPCTSPPCTSSRMPVHVMSPFKIEDNGGYATLPAFTPFPAKARPIRKRMKKIEKRMGKIKKGKWACRYDEVENDELAEDGEHKNVPSRQGKISGTGVRLKEMKPPNWDPFGDEEEL